jgi:hypothetical protein
MTDIEDVAGMVGIGRPGALENIVKCIEEAHEWSVTVETESNEIWRIGRSRKQNEDGVNSREVEAGIGEGGGRWMTESRNVEKCRERSEKIEESTAEGRRKLGKVDEDCGTSMKTAEGRMPSNNKIVDEKVTKKPGSSNKVKRSSAVAECKDLLTTRYNQDYFTSDILTEVE